MLIAIGNNVPYIMLHNKRPNAENAENAAKQNDVVSISGCASYRDLYHLYIIII